MEDGLNDVDSRVAVLERSYVDLRAENEKLRACVDDQENRSRRQNIRVVSLPEKSEGSHPTTFMATFLVEVFGGDSFPVKSTVDCAHHALRSPQPNGPPRAMIVHLHHYQTRELILRLS